MMRAITFFATLLMSFSVFATEIYCKNIDDYAEEDSLEFYSEGGDTYAYYFDNDSWRSILCETTARDGYLCEEEGLTVRMDESGYTTVEYSSGESVEFQCH